MIELFFVTCLIADPTVCTPHSLLFTEQHGTFSCMLQGQHELARWTTAHPAEVVREWKCRHPGQGERDA